MARVKTQLHLTRVADALGVELNREYIAAFHKVDYGRVSH